MKTDRMRELLTELRDREFSLEECYDLFACIHDYLLDRRNWIANIGKESQSWYRECLDFSEDALQQTLGVMRLDYTLDEFITYD